MKKIILFLFSIHFVLFAQDELSPRDIKDHFDQSQSLLVTDSQSGSGSIVGTVIDAVTNKPIQSAKIEILGMEKVSFSTKDGQYSFSSVPKGYYQIQSSAKGYISETKTNVSVKGGGEIELFFSLQINSEDPPDFVAVDKQPMPLSGNTPAPNYPSIARKDSLEAVVWLKLLVGVDGIPKKTSIFRSSFSKNGVDVDLESATELTKRGADSILIATKNAATQWRFTPAQFKDKPLAVWVSIPFKFKLSSQYDPKKKELKVSEDYDQPVPIENPWPKYPELAKKAGVEAMIHVKLTISETGNVTNAEIQQSRFTGPKGETLDDKSRSKNNIFEPIENAALETAKKWKFQPAMKSGKAVSAVVTLPFKFKLDEKKEGTKK